MEKIFRFRMLSDENDNFVRDYEIMSNQSLLDFHNFILNSLEYEECITSFFATNKHWERLCEYTLFDMNDNSEQSPVSMESVKIGAVVGKEHDRLIYLFDMLGDRAYFLEMTDIGEPQEGANYPREIYAREEAPDQYEAGFAVGEESIFDDIMADFNDFEGYDDEF